jgi:RNA polymerase sigma factor (TIGR02999 family)
MSGLPELLLAAHGGDQSAVDKIVELTYQELRDLARSRLRRSGNITTLDTTSLVHECYLRISKLERINTQTLPHFYAYAARVMRSIVVDIARQRSADKRNAGGIRVTLNTDLANAGCQDAEDIIRVHEALEELAAVDERLVRIVEMRYFAGLTEAQIAESLGINDRTVRRDWKKARMLLLVALQK